jgi:hypothetical protein
LITLFGFCTPPADMLPRTMVPASARATKKIQTRKIIAIDVNRKSGFCSS